MGARVEVFHHWDELLAWCPVFLEPGQDWPRPQGPTFLSSVQFSCSVMSDSLQPHGLPGFPVHHQLPELAQTHVHRVSDTIQPSHPLLPPSPPALNLSQHQGLFQWVSSSHQMAKVLELQLQYQSFQRIFRTEFLEDCMVWSPWSPRDSQESSPTPQSKNIDSTALSFLLHSASPNWPALLRDSWVSSLRVPFPSRNKPDMALPWRTPLAQWKERASQGGHCNLGLQVSQIHSACQECSRESDWVSKAEQELA